MGSNVVFFAWDRSIPGRERQSGAHFQEFVQYLGSLQRDGTIQSFETVFLDPHGGDMNGFFLVRGERQKLDELVASTPWLTHITRAGSHLNRAGTVRGVTGELVMERMALWTSCIPD